VSATTGATTNRSGRHGGPVIFRRGSSRCSMARARTARVTKPDLVTRAPGQKSTRGLEPLTTAFSALTCCYYSLMLRSLAVLGLWPTEGRNPCPLWASSCVENHGPNHGNSLLVANSGHTGQQRPSRRNGWPQVGHVGHPWPWWLLYFAAVQPRGLSSPIPCLRRSVVICSSLILGLLAAGGRSRTELKCNYGCNSQSMGVMIRTCGWSSAR
jgi:hypothetical protein